MPLCGLLLLWRLLLILPGRSLSLLARALVRTVPASAAVLEVRLLLSRSLLLR